MAALLTKEQLLKLGVSQANVDKFYAPLVAAMQKGGIDTAERVKYFIPQLLHESGNFRYVQELASGEAYEGRKDLGNVEAGDGKKFKGRGLIQITGRNNYKDVGKALGVDFISNPTLLENPKYATESAVWFWNSRKLSDVADKPDTWTTNIKGKVYDKFKYITYRINGGLNGLEDRLAKFAKIKDFVFENKKAIAGAAFFFWILAGLIALIIYKNTQK